MVQFDVQCNLCKTVHTISVPQEDLIKWQGGMLVQDAFPYLDPTTRELMISNTCNGCWKKIFAKKKQ